MDNKPNIVFIHTDQQRGDCLSCADHPVLETPTMDNIAFNGVRLTSFYAGCPVCVPARRSMLIGQSPQKHGIISNASREIPDAVATLPGELRKNGYQTYHVGRDFHQHPRRNFRRGHLFVFCLHPRITVVGLHDGVRDHVPIASNNVVGVFTPNQAFHSE